MAVVAAVVAVTGTEEVVIIMEMVAEMTVETENGLRDAEMTETGSIGTDLVESLRTKRLPPTSLHHLLQRWQKHLPLKHLPLKHPQLNKLHLPRKLE